MHALARMWLSTMAAAPRGAWVRVHSVCACVCGGGACNCGNCMHQRACGLSDGRRLTGRLKECNTICLVKPDHSTARPQALGATGHGWRVIRSKCRKPYCQPPHLAVEHAQISLTPDRCFQAFTHSSSPAKAAQQALPASSPTLPSSMPRSASTACSSGSSREPLPLAS